MKPTPLAVRLLMIASIIILSALNLYAEYPAIWQVAVEPEMPARDASVSVAQVKIDHPSEIDAADTDIPEIDRAGTMAGCPVSMNMMVSCWVAMYPSTTEDFVATATVTPTVFDAAPARSQHPSTPEVLIHPPRV